METLATTTNPESGIYRRPPREFKADSNEMAARCEVFRLTDRNGLGVAFGEGRSGVRSWLHSSRVAVRGPFLYVSSAKLNSMSPTRRWWRRISGFTAGVPGGSLGVTLDPADSAWPTRIEQIDRRLTAEQRVKSAHDAAFGPAGGLFRFDGNAGVLAALGTY